MLDYRLEPVCPVHVGLGLKLRPEYSKEIKCYHLNIWGWTDGSTVKSTVAPSEDEKKLGLIPASTWQLTHSVTPTPGINTLFWHQRVLQICVAQIKQNTHA